MKYYYDSIFLPEIPVDSFTNCPYLMILQNIDGSMFAYGSTSKPYYKLQSSVKRLELPNGRSRALYNTSDDVWGDVNTSTSSTYCNLSESWTILWSNFNIPNGSATATEVFFYGSTPIPYYEEGYLKTSARAYHMASDSSPASISIEAIMGDMLVIGIAARSEFTIPEGFVKCFTSDPCGTQTLSMLYKIVDEDGLQTVTFLGTESVVVYLIAMVFRDIKKIRYTGAYYNHFTDAGTSAFSVDIKKNQKGICTLWGITCNYASTSPNDYNSTPNDMYSIQAADPLQERVRLKMFFDNGTGELEHTISYNMTGEYTYSIDAIELYPYDFKYLIRSMATIYTINNGELTSLGDMDLVADTFKTYGMEDIPNESSLVGLENPEILFWQDGENELPVITATLTATPLPQTIITNEIDLSDPSITGVEFVTTEYDGNPLYACSFDGGATWNAHNGMEWTVLSETDTGMSAEVLMAITTEQWTEKVIGIDSFMMRFTLSAKEDKVTNIVVDYTN